MNPEFSESNPYGARVAVVVNGNAKQVNEEIVEVLDQIVQTGDLFVSRSLEEGQGIARTIVSRQYPIVLTGGGDGTFVQMVTWVTEESTKQGKPRPKFGFLRLGTGNALAWVLGAKGSRGNELVADLARLSRNRSSRKLRLIRVDGVLTPFAGLGIDAIALNHYNSTKEKVLQVPILEKFGAGALSYIFSITTKTFPYCYVNPQIHVRIINEGKEAFRLGMDGRPIGNPIRKGEVIFEGPTKMAAASTIPYLGFGARVFPFAEDREDRFHLRLTDINPADMMLNLRKIWRGTFRHPLIHDYLTEKITIECDKPTPYQVGGDIAGVNKVIHMELDPEPIEVADFYSPPKVQTS